MKFRIYSLFHEHENKKWNAVRGFFFGMTVAFSPYAA